MDNIKHIGGFFELEKNSSARFDCHPNAIAFNTGRACLTRIIEAKCPKIAYVPYYTCEAVLAPFRICKVELAFYGVDRNLIPLELPRLGDRECLLYTNYFGICDKQVETLRQHFGTRLIVDDTHAFFHGERPGLWSFTSARKYFGVPDGAFLYSPVPLVPPGEPFPDYSLEHLRLRAEGRQADAFAAYRRYEQSLDCRVFRISDYSREQLRCVDFTEVAEIRRRNFACLHATLGSSNRMAVSMEGATPFCYPYLPETPVPHDLFYERSIYPPRLWPDMLQRDCPPWERNLAQNLLPLPIDHRYDETDMKYILTVIGDLS